MGHKRSISERLSYSQARIGQGSLLCEQLHEQMVSQFENNVSENTIERNLGISSSTVHNIKRFRESGEISAHKGQGQKPTLNACDLRSLRQHSIKKQHSVKDITTWAQGYFGKPLSVNTVCCYIYNCKLKLFNAKR